MNTRSMIFALALAALAFSPAVSLAQEQSIPPTGRGTVQFGGSIQYFNTTYKDQGLREQTYTTTILDAEALYFFVDRLAAGPALDYQWQNGNVLSSSDQSGHFEYGLRAAYYFSQPGNRWAPFVGAGFFLSSVTEQGYSTVLDQSMEYTQHESTLEFRAGVAYFLNPWASVDGIIQYRSTTRTVEDAYVRDGYAPQTSLSGTDVGVSFGLSVWVK